MDRVEEPVRLVRDDYVHKVLPVDVLDDDDKGAQGVA